MNLNFIQDNDQVHVQTQNQFAYKQQIILKAKLLKQDYTDYKQINPSLVQINTLFTQIVKDLYQHVTNVKNRQIAISQREITVSVIKDSNLLEYGKKRKKISIPYGTMKKLQNLKQKFIHCQKIIQLQNNYYRRFNINSENEKKSQVKFYKQVLTSYENQRQYYKKQTLKLQDRVQQVQTQVKKVSYNENNPFTDFDSKTISIESIIKYEKKLAAFKKFINQLNLLKQARTKIIKDLKIDYKQPPNKIDNKNTQRQKIAYAKNYLKSIVQTQKKINLLKITKNQLLQGQLIKIYNQVDKLKIVNERLKKAILQSQGEKFFLQLQQKLTQKNQQKRTKPVKVTKTDYIIYLKQLNAKVKSYFKNKQIVYRYKLLTDKVSFSRSKSVNFLLK